MPSFMEWAPCSGEGLVRVATDVKKIEMIFSHKKLVVIKIMTRSRSNRRTPLTGLRA